MANQQQNEGTAIVVQGRFVWGSLDMRKKKVYGSQQDAINPKTGEPVMEVAFGLAIPKPSPQSNQHEVENFQKFWQAVHAEAAKLGFQQGDSRFAWKFVDGDGKKADGSPHPEHSRGCIVVTCSTRFPLKLMAWEGSEIKQVTSDQIKCGDYVQVALNLQGHGAPNAGMYTNPSYVARFAYGAAIVNAPNPTAIFGGAPPPMPMGASATPVGGGQMAVPTGMVGQPGPMVPGPVQPAYPGQGQQTPAPTPQAPQQPQYPGNPMSQQQPQAPQYHANYNPLPAQFQPQMNQQAPAPQQPMQGQQQGYFPPGFNQGGNGQ